MTLFQSLLSAPTGPATPATLRPSHQLTESEDAFALTIQEEEAAGLSEALAQLLTANRPWRQCRDQLLAAYPVAKRARRDRFAEVMAGQRDFTAAELAAELPDLRRTLAQLGVAGEEELGPERFLALLRQKAQILASPPRAVWQHLRLWQQVMLLGDCAREYSYALKF
jgi:hypothetical protein